MLAVWLGLGAWESTPPEPMMRSAFMGGSRESPPLKAKAWAMPGLSPSPLSPVAKARCCKNDRESASRARACSRSRSGTESGTVVGRMVLFITALRISRSPNSWGTHRSRLSGPLSTSTLDAE